jgi:hypothetical protein
MQCFVLLLTHAGLKAVLPTHYQYSPLGYVTLPDSYLYYHLYIRAPPVGAQTPACSSFISCKSKSPLKSPPPLSQLASRPHHIPSESLTSTLNTQIKHLALVTPLTVPQDHNKLAQPI